MFKSDISQIYTTHSFDDHMALFTIYGPPIYYQAKAHSSKTEYNVHIVNSMDLSENGDMPTPTKL